MLKSAGVTQRLRYATALSLMLGGALLCNAGGVKPSFRVSSFGLGPAGPAIAAEEFAGTLTGAGWCEARVEPRARWDTLSPAGDGSVQVSVVTAGFGDQAHAYAFLADPRGKGFAGVAHIPYRNEPNRRGIKEWQRPMGALANALFDVWALRDEDRPRARARITVGGDASDDGASGNALSLDSLIGGGTADASDMMHTQAEGTFMPPFRAIAIAAAMEAG